MRILVSNSSRRTKQRHGCLPYSLSLIFCTIIVVIVLHFWLLSEGLNVFAGSFPSNPLSISRRNDVFLLSHYDVMMKKASTQFLQALQHIAVSEKDIHGVSTVIKERYLQTKVDDLLYLSEQMIWIGPILHREIFSELSPSTSIAWPSQLDIDKEEARNYYELHVQALPSGSILVFDTFPTSVKSLSFDNIYQYFDDFIHFIRYFRSLNPKLNILWIAPHHPFTESQGRDREELEAIFHHLILQQVINHFGVMVMDETDVDDAKDKLLSHWNTLHFYALQHFQFFPHDYTSISKNLATTAADFQHRVKLITTYLSHFYTEENESQSLQEACNKLVNTRKFSSTCFPSIGTRYPLLVTGLGGSGTHFVANSLQTLGFRLNHESIGTQGSVVSTLNISLLFLF